MGLCHNDNLNHNPPPKLMLRTHKSPKLSQLITKRTNYFKKQIYLYSALFKTTNSVVIQLLQIFTVTFMMSVKLLISHLLFKLDFDISVQKPFVRSYFN